MMESCLNSTTKKPIVVIDLGVPRDVEPEIANLDDVYLYSIDDLGKVIENNYKIYGKKLIIKLIKFYINKSYNSKK